ncbi:MAG TPA: FliM/FliN family flagellar motor switch protein [Conexibacter sp.]|nr:FliM/FliN family flagellar motor switch protein [Conexibacter sp.]
MTGGNVLLLTPAAARRIAAAMSKAPAADAPAGEDELTELELSAVAEAANQMMAAAASATSLVLGQGVEIAPPETRTFDSATAAQEAFAATPHAISTTFGVGGEPCRLVQLIPNAFVVRTARALAEQGAEHVGHVGLDGVQATGGAQLGDERALDDALRDIRVRVWAELGRTHVALGHAPELPPGAVLELDRKADDPVDLYVNGLRFGSGQLVLTDEGEWALRLLEVAGREALAESPTPIPTPDPEGAVA